MQPFVRALPGFLLVHTLAVVAQGPSPTQETWNIAPTVYYQDRANVLPSAPVLAHSLATASKLLHRHAPPPDAAAWSAQRPQIEQAFRRTLGLVTLPDRSPLNPRVTATNQFGSYTVENVIFESRPGFQVTANLYRPTAPGPRRRPAILSPVGHFLSAGKTATDVQARCIGLAQLGFVVLTYDAIGQGERLVPGNIHHEAGYALLPLGETIAGWMVWDSMRALDYLETLDDVDPTRLGITGNSGGGLNALFTAALDSRVRAAAVAGFTFEFDHWVQYGGTHCTCTHLPGVFASMEWFAIAGLIAPRPLLMLQGEQDSIFPIIGARRAALATSMIYQHLNSPHAVRFAELRSQPHAYTRPFRDVMYPWMVRHLVGLEASPESPEPRVSTLPEKDPRLLCDTRGALGISSNTVVRLARVAARRHIERLPAANEPARIGTTATWLARLNLPDAASRGYLAPRTVQKPNPTQRIPEKLSVISEPGIALPGLIWLPPAATSAVPVIVIADAHGKSKVAESDLLPALIEEGFAIVSFDLRGRGETLGRYSARHDIGFRLTANQILCGEPLAGRRAFDLQRIADLIESRRELDSSRITLVGVGDDALPALIAAGVDPRFRRLAMAGFLHSFSSAMSARLATGETDLSNAWNDPQLDGRITTEHGVMDFGSVIPGALPDVDIPDLVALLAPRPLLACNFRDNEDPLARAAIGRFRNAFRAPVANASEYSPESQLDRETLLRWLRRSSPASP